MALTWEQARQRAGQQVDPIHQRAVQNVNQQTYQNQLNAGNMAANRGLGRSGLAADLQNKQMIAGQNNVADLEAQRAARIAELSERMVNRDQDQGRWQQEFDYRRQRGTVGDQRWREQFNYDRYRDTVGDVRWQNEYNYRGQRDQIGDQRWQDQFNYQRSLEEWRRKYVGQRDSVGDQQYRDDLDLRRRLAQYQAMQRWTPYTF